jgi:hypothetical protein
VNALIVKALSLLVVEVLWPSGQAVAQESGGMAQTNPDTQNSALAVPSPPAEDKPSGPLWHYGAYLDVSYILNFNFPENHLWRTRTTAFRHNEFAPNMALTYVRKDATESSRWGTELGVQGGYDSQNFAFLPGEREVSGADTLRHIHRANVSYLAPIGKGLTITGGLFNSLIGYESLYAKDNVNYTRSWLPTIRPT